MNNIMTLDLAYFNNERKEISLQSGFRYIRRSIFRHLNVAGDFQRAAYFTGLPGHVVRDLL
jgi:hypothetical protein